MSKSNHGIAERERTSTSGRTETALQPATDIVEYLRSYCRKEPETAALWCLGIGFVLGWKLKLW
jgi:hypothetical protein